MGNELGLFRDELRLVESKEEWPLFFNDEAIRLQELCPADSMWEHIGSTAVPGLCAKPIIDMMLGLEPAAVPSAAEKLETFGYSKGGYLYSQTDYLLFTSPEPITHILHLVHRDSQEYQDKLLFRDLLRRDENIRKKYQALKLKLSRRMDDNKKDYGRYKAHFILDQLSKANAYESC